MLLNHHERNGREDIGDEFDDQPVALFEAAIAVNIRQQTVVQEALADRASSMSSTLRRGLASDHIRWLATGKDARKVREQEKYESTSNFVRASKLISTHLIAPG